MPVGAENCVTVSDRRPRGCYPGSLATVTPQAFAVASCPATTTRRRSWPPTSR